MRYHYAAQLAVLGSRARRCEVPEWGSCALDWTFDVPWSFAEYLICDLEREVVFSWPDDAARSYEMGKLEQGRPIELYSYPLHHVADALETLAERVWLQDPRCPSDWRRGDPLSTIRHVTQGETG